jgi:hypothetical protein
MHAMPTRPRSFRVPSRPVHRPRCASRSRVDPSAAARAAPAPRVPSRGPRERLEARRASKSSSTQVRPRADRRKYAPGGTSQKADLLRSDPAVTQLARRDGVLGAHKLRARRADLPALDIPIIMSTCGGQRGGALKVLTASRRLQWTRLPSNGQAPCRIPAQVSASARARAFRPLHLRTARQLRSRARSGSPGASARRAQRSHRLRLSAVTPAA